MAPWPAQDAYAYAADDGARDDQTTRYAETNYSYDPNAAPYYDQAGQAWTWPGNNGLRGGAEDAYDRPPSNGLRGGAAFPGLRGGSANDDYDWDRGATTSTTTTTTTDDRATRRRRRTERTDRAHVIMMYKCKEHVLSMRPA